jgi:5-methylcytosine-specific restriction endonuclease McrA
VFLEVYPQVLGVSTLKRCLKCGEYKPADRDHFHRSPATRDGLQTRCRTCRNLTDKRQKVMPVAREGYKYCPRCERELPLNPEFFSADKARKNGFSTHCRMCATAYSKEYRTANPEKHAQSKRNWRAAHPEEVRAHRSASQKRNRKSANERTKRYYEGHPEKRLEGVHARRARILGNGGRYTPADIEAIRKAQTDKRGRVRCWVCGNPMPSNDQTIDHFIPLKHGGSNGPGNIRLAHMLCNQSKGAKHPHELGRLI